MPPCRGACVTIGDQCDGVHVHSSGVLTINWLMAGATLDGTKVSTALVAVARADTRNLYTSHSGFDPGEKMNDPQRSLRFAAHRGG